jgi:large subunit ribosomal protein L9
VSVTVKVNVARSPEEADLQAQGIDVLQQMFEEEAAPLVAEELGQEAVAEEPAEAPAEEPTAEQPTSEDEAQEG